MTAVANLLTGLAALYLAVRAGDGAVLGPARTDDLPYGDLLRLDRTGALVWLLVAGVGVAAAVTAQRVVLLMSAGLWAAVSAVVLVVVVTNGTFWGASRPSDLALSSGLALSAAVAWLELTRSGDGGGGVSERW